VKRYGPGEVDAETVPHPDEGLLVSICAPPGTGESTVLAHLIARGRGVAVVADIDEILEGGSLLDVKFAHPSAAPICPAYDRLWDRIGGFVTRAGFDMVLFVQVPSKLPSPQLGAVVGWEIDDHIRAARLRDRQESEATVADARLDAKALRELSSPTSIVRTSGPIRLRGAPMRSGRLRSPVCNSPRLRGTGTGRRWCSDSLMPLGARLCCDGNVESTHHRGVYGIWRHAGELVLVRKARGPYTGLLDLPGGAPEPGESTHETLRRELREETGVELAHVVNAQPFSIHVTVDSSVTSIDFHHEGWISEVRAEGSLNYTIDDNDVLGVVLVASSPNEQMSPLAIEALWLFPALAAGRSGSGGGPDPARG